MEVNLSEEPQYHGATNRLLSGDRLSTWLDSCAIPIGGPLADLVLRWHLRALNSSKRGFFLGQVADPAWQLKY